MISIYRTKRNAEFGATLMFGGEVCVLFRCSLHIRHSLLSREIKTQRTKCISPFGVERESKNEYIFLLLKLIVQKHSAVQ